MQSNTILNNQTAPTFHPPKVLQNTLKVLLTITDDSGLTILEKLLSGKLTENDITFLNHNENFPNTQVTIDTDENNYDDYHFKTTIAVKDFVSFISPYLTDQQLFHLVERFIPKEALDGEASYRNMNLAKAFMLEAIKRHDPNQSMTSQKRNLPPCLLFHFQRLAEFYEIFFTKLHVKLGTDIKSVDFSNKLALGFNMFINFNLYGTQTNQIECYQPVKDFNSSTFNSNALSNQCKKDQNSCLKTTISLVKLDLNHPQTFADVCCLDVNPEKRKELQEKIIRAVQIINQEIELFDKSIKLSVDSFCEVFEKINNTTACENFLNNQIMVAFGKLLLPCIERIALQDIKQSCQGISETHLNQLLKFTPYPNEEVITRATLLITQGFDTLLRLNGDQKLFELFMQQAKIGIEFCLKYLTKEDVSNLKQSLEQIFENYQKKFLEKSINLQEKSKSFCEFIKNGLLLENTNSNQSSKTKIQPLSRSLKILKPTNNRSFFSFSPVTETENDLRPKNIRPNTISLKKTPEVKKSPSDQQNIQSEKFYEELQVTLKNKCNTSRIEKQSRKNLSNQINTQPISFEELQERLKTNSNKKSSTKFKLPTTTLTPSKQVGTNNSLRNSSSQITEKSDEKNPLLSSLIKETVRENSNHNQENTSDKESLPKPNSQNNLRPPIKKNPSNPKKTPENFKQDLNNLLKIPPKKGALAEKTIAKNPPPNKVAKNPTQNPTKSLGDLIQEQKGNNSTFN